MTDAVVEVGPVTVRGPNSAEMEWVSAGIEAIDDELTLIDDRAIAVADIWRTIMADVVGGPAETMVIVCPTWWSSSRVERVYEAAQTVAGDVAMLRRADLLSDQRTWLVEIASEFLVVSSAAGVVDVVRRGDTDALVSRIPTSTSVLVDAPEGVEEARLVADRLRANGVDAVVADRDWVLRSVDAPPLPDEVGKDEARAPARRSRRTTAVLVGTLVSAAVVGVGFAARENVPAGDDIPMTLLVEGRVGVMVPAQWKVKRVTSGPGSARVQVVSPDDATVALHVTQSSLPPQQSHGQIVDSLREALGQEPDGVFVEFNPFHGRAGRPVVTYREIRPDHHIAWVVLIDQSLRIAVGCQSAPGREEAVREVCDRAIRSAHAVF